MQNPKYETERMRDYYQQFSRNFRWGTCVDCPRDSEGHVYPEFCGHTERHDHNLNAEELLSAFQRYQKDLRLFEERSSDTSSR